MKNPLTVFVLCNQYVILDSPEPLTDEAGTRCKAQIDHQQHIIWIDPAVAGDARLSLLIRAVSRAWQERLGEARPTEDSAQSL